MQSTNSLKEYPIQISFYYNQVTNEIFKDKNFIEINEFLSDKNNIGKYTYSIYTDLNLLKPNIFVPIFDTIYLASRNHNVVLNSTNDFWLCDLYKQNKYFFVGSCDHKSIQSIESITEISNEI
jgi:hypothetical protein